MELDVLSLPLGAGPRGPGVAKGGCAPLDSVTRSWGLGHRTQSVPQPPGFRDRELGHRTQSVPLLPSILYRVGLMQLTLFVQVDTTSLLNCPGPQDFVQSGYHFPFLRPRAQKFGPTGKETSAEASRFPGGTSSGTMT